MKKEIELLPGVKGEPLFKSDKERDEWYERMAEKLREANKPRGLIRNPHDHLLNLIHKQDQEITELNKRLDRIEKRLNREKELDGTENL